MKKKFIFNALLILCSQSFSLDQITLRFQENQFLLWCYSQESWGNWWLWTRAREKKEDWNIGLKTPYLVYGPFSIQSPSGAHGSWARVSGLNQFLKEPQVSWNGAGDNTPAIMLKPWAGFWLFLEEKPEGVIWEGGQIFTFGEGAVFGAGFQDHGKRQNRQGIFRYEFLEDRTVWFFWTLDLDFLKMSHYLTFQPSLLYPFLPQSHHSFRYQLWGLQTTDLWFSPFPLPPSKNKESPHWGISQNVHLRNSWFEGELHIRGGENWSIYESHEGYIQARASIGLFYESYSFLNIKGYYQFSPSCPPEVIDVLRMSGIIKSPTIYDFSLSLGASSSFPIWGIEDFFFQVMKESSNWEASIKIFPLEGWRIQGKSKFILPFLGFSLLTGVEYNPQDKQSLSWSLDLVWQRKN